jgi:hypothetical protein
MASPGALSRERHAGSDPLHSAVIGTVEAGASEPIATPNPATSGGRDDIRPEKRTVPEPAAPPPATSIPAMLAEVAAGLAAGDLEAARFAHDALARRLYPPPRASAAATVADPARLNDPATAAALPRTRDELRGDGHARPGGTREQGAPGAPRAPPHAGLQQAHDEAESGNEDGEEASMDEKSTHETGDLGRPTPGSGRLEDHHGYNVRLEFARGTELAMTRRAAELGLKGPKGVIMHALLKLGVEVDANDQKMLRRMKQEREGAPETVASTQPQPASSSPLAEWVEEDHPYNVRLQLARGTELGMTRKAAELCAGYPLHRDLPPRSLSELRAGAEARRAAPHDDRAAHPHARIHPLDRTQ